MPSKEPSDLINKSQIGFREVAGLSSFNPQHPTLKSLPTVQNSISALDASPSRFQCKHCEAKLLRGSQSLICIYCGQCQAKDLPPEPIVFNSTTGCRWLLQSLNLNASEMIEPLVEEKRKNKVGTPVEGGKVLSEFLDVQIRWPDELEIPETSYVNKMLDHSSSLHFSRVFSDNFEQMDSHSGSDASEEYAVSSKDDQIGGFEDQDNLSLFQKFDVPETDANMSSDLSGERDTELQPSNSSAQNEDSLFGDDTEIQSENEDFSKSVAARDSLSGNEEEIESVNSMRQNEDSKSDSSVHDAEIQPVNSRVDDDLEDSKDIASNLSRNSSSGDEAINLRPNKDSKTADMSSSLSDDGHEAAVNSRAHNEATINVSSDLKEDSSSGDDAEIQSRRHNEGPETGTIISTLKDHGNDAEIDPRAQNNESEAIAAMVSDLKRDSSSGDESMNLRRLNDDSKTANRSSNSSDDGHEATVNSRAQNDDYEANVNVSSDLNRDSSSGDDAESHSRRQNEASEAATISSHSFAFDAEIDPRAQNEESKAAMESDLKRDSSSGDESMKFRRLNDDSKTADRSSNLSDEGNEAAVNSRAHDEGIKATNHVSTDLNRDSSSGDDAESHSRIHNEDSKTAIISSNSLSDTEIDPRAQNEDSEATAAMISDLKRDSSSEDESMNFGRPNKDSITPERSSNLSDDGHEAAVNSRAHDEDFKATTNVSTDLNNDSSSGDDAEVHSRRQNEASEAATISSNSFGNDAEIDPRAQKEDFEATAAMVSELKRDSSSEDESKNSKTVSVSNDLSGDVLSSGHDVETQPVDSRAQIKYSRATAVDLRRDSSSEDDTDIHSKDSKTAAIFSNLSDDDSSEQNSRLQNQDSKITAVMSDLSRDSSSGDENSKIQNQDSRISVIPSNLSNDDADIHPVNSRAQNKDSKDSSSGDDNSKNINVDSKAAPIPLDSLNSRRRNEDSKATTTDLKKDSSSEDEEHSRPQNKDSTNSATPSHDLNNNDAEIQSVNSRATYEEDSKTTSAISPRESFSGDENPRNSSSTHATTVSFYDLHGGHDVEIESLNSRRWNQDSRTRSHDSKATVYHDLSGDGSSGEDTEFQSGHSRWNTSTAKSYDFRTDSSSGDDLQFHSRVQQNHDSNSLHRIDSDVKPQHPSISDDKVQDKD